MEINVIKAWEHAANTDQAQAAIHPSGAIGPIEYAATGAASAADLVSIAERWCEAPEPWSFLDWGCGDGRITLPLQDMVTAHGYDTSPTMIERAQKRGVVGATNDLGDLDPDYSVTFSLAVVIHQSFRDGYELVENLYERTTPGGLVIFDVPVYEVGHERESWTHVTSWTPDQFATMLSTLNVEVLETHQYEGEFSYAEPRNNTHVLKVVS